MRFAAILTSALVAVAPAISQEPTRVQSTSYETMRPEISTPGGASQDQQILNVLLNLLVFRMPLQAAVEMPRINSLHFHRSFDDHESLPGVLEIEDRVDKTVRDDLTPAATSCASSAVTP